MCSVMRRIGISISSTTPVFSFFFKEVVCVRAPKSSNDFTPSHQSHWTLISRKREAYTSIEAATVMATFTYCNLYTFLC